MTSHLLSKTKYLTGLQCPRLIWTQFHEPELIPETDPVTQYIFDQGHEVGYLAKKLFSGGIDVPQDSFMGNIDITKELLKERKPLFEAGILDGKLYSRVDILSPAGEEGWGIVEVKSSTSVKDVHINDVAYQRYCCNQSGLNIRKCYLALINNQYVKDGEIDPEGLFNIHDVTDQVEEASVGIQDRIDDILEVVGQETCPEMIIGPHCRDPYKCPLTDCWDHLPEHNIFTLYYGGKKSFEMYNSGIVTIREIPDDYKLNDKQHIQQACTASGEPHVDREAIHGFLSSLEYPLYYLDFETFNPAIPIYNGTRPYQKVPFQFSLHVVDKPGVEPEHYGFLGDGNGDPRPDLLAELKRVLGNHGNIVVYNQSFEKGVLAGLGQAFPGYAVWVEETCNRVVDLYAPFRSFSYYHPMQQGSMSIKKVLPALTGKGYDDLEIAKGDDASLAFFNIVMGVYSEEENQKIRQDLEMYCSLDTRGMAWIIERLNRLCL